MIKIDTIGNGMVEIVEDETSTTLTATPIKGYDFKHYVIGGNEVKANPYSFDASGIVSGQAVFYQSINSLLANCVQGIDITGLIPSVLRRRKVEYGADLDDLDEKDVELCTADIYYDSTNIPSSKRQNKDADGGWSHDEGGFSMDASTKNSLVAKALAIYTKYNDDRAVEVQTANENKKIIVEYNSSKSPAKPPERKPVNVKINLL